MTSEYILQDVQGRFAKVSLTRMPLLALYDCLFVMKDGSVIKGDPSTKIPSEVPMARKIIGMSKDLKGQELHVELRHRFPLGYAPHTIGFFTQDGFRTIPKERMPLYDFGR